MKKNLLLISLFLIFSSLSIVSQTIEPDALYFSIPQSTGRTTKQFSIADPEYAMDKFLLTWQWGNHPRLTKALKMNSTHSWAPSWGPNDIVENNTGTEIDFIWAPSSWVEPNIYAVPHFLSHSFTYKPTCTVNPDVFSSNPNDSEHNIWGFRERNITNPVIVNNRLQLLPSDAKDSAVLSNPWRCNNFYMIHDFDTTSGIDVRSYNGKYWNVTLNLRRKDFSTANDTSDNAPVLVIKIPYYLTAGSSIDSGRIMLNTKPNPTIRSEMNYTYSDGTNNHTVNRGYCLDMTNTIPIDSIVITRNMLPDYVDSTLGIGPDITITFSFIADMNIGHGNNPFFKTSASDTTHEMIDSIGLDVYYRGNCGILLNYIRVGNPLSDKMWKGELDTLYHSKIQEFGVGEIRN